MRRRLLWVGLGLCLCFGAVGVWFSTANSGTAATIPADFTSTWERTDRPVAEGQASRTWMWGPQAYVDARFEPYADAPGGERLVQYFDKARMEITDPDGDPSEPWHVTNGLLARELITGEVQLGDTTFEHRQPAQLHIAGDTHSDTPTYATFNAFLDAEPVATGTILTQTIDRQGTISTESRYEDYQIVAAYYVDSTDQTIASAFWEFMNAQGLVFVDGEFAHGDLFEDPFFGVGLPITGAYWMHVPVGGAWTDVLAQCFERRCLTYTPSNPDGWQVEAGNIGQHYYAWRYGDGSGEQDLRPSDEELGPPIPGECEAVSQAVFTEVSDSLGNVNTNSWGQGTGGDWPGGFDAAPAVAVGEQLSATIEASGDCEPLEYRVQRYRPDRGIEIIEPWSESAQISYTFEPGDVGEYLMLIVDVRNQDPRNHFDDRDDYTYLTYIVD